MTIKQYIQVAEQYYFEHYFFESLEEFLQFNNIIVEKMDVLKRYIIAEFHKQNTPYIIDRIQREFKDNDYCKLVKGDEYCIIHRSPKYKGYFQCSLFDKNGAYCDFNEETIYLLAKHLTDNYRGFNFE